MLQINALFLIWMYLASASLSKCLLCFRLKKFSTHIFPWKYFTLLKSPKSFFYAKKFLQSASIYFSFFPHSHWFLTLLEKHLHANCTHCSSISLILSLSRCKTTSVKLASALAAFAAAPPWQLKLWIIFIFYFDP